MKFPLKEIQSTWTQRPTASSSYPYVEIVLGDVAAQRTMQLQLEQVGPRPAPRPCHPPSLPISLTRLQGDPPLSPPLVFWPGHREHPAQCRDRTTPALHRTAAFTAVSPRGLGDEIGKEPGCLQNREEFVGNREAARTGEVLEVCEGHAERRAFLWGH